MGKKLYIISSYEVHFLNGKSDEVFELINEDGMITGNQYKLLELGYIFEIFEGRNKILELPVIEKEE